MPIEPEVRALRRLQTLAKRWKIERPGVAAAMQEALGAFRLVRPRGPWRSRDDLAE